MNERTLSHVLSGLDFLRLQQTSRDPITNEDGLSSPISCIDLFFGREC